MKVNELEISITFRWMAEAELTEQYVSSYITSTLLQLHAPEPALHRGKVPPLLFLRLSVTFLISSSHLSCDLWARPCYDVLSSLLPLCTLCELKSCVSLSGRCSTTWLSLSVNMSLMLAFYINSTKLYCAHAPIKHR